MTQLVVNDFCKCSFDVDNVVVFFIYTNNIQVILILLTCTNYKCSKSKIFFVCLFTLNCLFTSNWVKGRDSRRMCKIVYTTVSIYCELAR